MANPIVVERDTIDGDRRYKKHYYWCPGCDMLHGIGIAPAARDGGKPGWDFTGTLECPTYAPSQLTRWTGKVDGVPVEHVCHTFIRDGQIEFLTDSTHALAGRTVPLPPLPDWFIKEQS